jgi:pimeloyl-ACP methyl ester carboxylesterase
LRLRFVLAATVLATLTGGCEVMNQENSLFFPEKLAADYKFEFKQLREEFLVDVASARLNVLRFYPGHARGSVMYFHGNAGSLREWGQVASELSGLGLEVFIVDYRGYGKSTGEIRSYDQFLADAEVVFLACQRKTSLQLAVYGRSLGTGVAAYIASRLPVKGVLLESPYSSMKALAEFHFPYLPSSLLRYPFSTLDWLKTYPGVVFGFHGNRDVVVPYRESEKIKAELGNRYKLTTIPGGNHNDLNSFPAFLSARKTAFEAVFGPG